MSSKQLRGVGLALVVSGLVEVLAAAQGARSTPTFYPDDPITVDDDAAFDASGAKEIELSENFDFLRNTFAAPGDRSPIHARNVNTVDEVPDSSWFANRIGVRRLSIEELRRGPNKFDRLDATEWTVVQGKGPGGFQPGFRAVHPGDPEQVYQIEVDAPRHPQLATGAELIGTLIYHALGYHVEDVYTLKVDPARVKISDKATVRDASGRRRFTQHDLDSIWQQAAHDADGRIYVSATRFEEGKDLGQFEYFGTRRDDPNDIYPHEHRRELRGNRVFAAWLAHDDSRAVNTRNILVESNGRKHLLHYMYDFGAILGSATRFGEPATNNNEYYFDRGESLRALATFGLSVPPYLRSTHRSAPPPSVGRFDGEPFDPARWKPNYPNPAFVNMQPADAFWGARLVSRFSEEGIRAIVGRAEYDDPRATEYLTRALIERRDAIARTWLTIVNPIVEPVLANDTLTFTNAAVAAGVATPAASYAITWSRFDNRTGAQLDATTEMTVTDTRASAPPALLAGSEFVVATIRTGHPDFPGWRVPVSIYFRHIDSGWKIVGLFR